jgi:hypothetical protein
MTVTVVGGYRALPDPLTAIALMANLMNVLRSRTPVRLYVYDAVLERLAQDLEPMAAELRPCIQEEDAVVGPRHVARPRHVAPADQPDRREGVMRGAPRAGRHQCGAVARQARDTMDAGRLKGFGQGHGRQDRGESPRQHRRASARGAEQGGGCEQNACMTFSFTSTSKGADDHYGESFLCLRLIVKGAVRTAPQAILSPPVGRPGQLPW